MFDLTSVLMLIAAALFIFQGTGGLKFLAGRKVHLGWIGMFFLTLALYSIQAG